MATGCIGERFRLYHYTIFVRFRQTRRLQVSLIETRRIAAKVQHEHVASLGAIDLSPSVADRVAFWLQLHERLGKLSNRMDAETHAKILCAVHARIPMVTIKEQRALQLANAEADERFWARLRDNHEATADDHKALAKSVERTIAEAQAGAKVAAAKAKAAKERAARIRRGEDVTGGLGKPFTLEDWERILRDAGMTTKDIERCVTVARISDLGGFEELIQETLKLQKRAERAATRTVLKRLTARSREGGNPPA